MMQIHSCEVQVSTDRGAKLIFTVFFEQPLDYVPRVSVQSKGGLVDVKSIDLKVDPKEKK